MGGRSKITYAKLRIFDVIFNNREIFKQKVSNHSDFMNFIKENFGLLDEENEERYSKEYKPERDIFKKIDWGLFNHVGNDVWSEAESWVQSKTVKSKTNITIGEGFILLLLSRLNPIYQAILEEPDQEVKKEKLYKFCEKWSKPKYCIDGHIDLLTDINATLNTDVNLEETREFNIYQAILLYRKEMLKNYINFRNQEKREYTTGEIPFAEEVDLFYTFSQKHLTKEAVRSFLKQKFLRLPPHREMLLLLSGEPLERELELESLYSFIN